MVKIWKGPADMTLRRKWVAHGAFFRKRCRAIGYTKPNMDLADRLLVQKAVEQWVTCHREPHKPILYAGTYGYYSPAQIAENLNAKTPGGRFLWQLIENAAKTHTVKEILRMFDPTQPEPAPVAVGTSP